MRTLSPTPIDPERYAPFGSLIGAAGSPRIANHGAAIAWDGLATLLDSRADAQMNASLFRCKPLEGTSLELRHLERHPHSTQLFIPMNASRYLIVVARGGDEPDFTTLAAFLVGGSQAIQYAAGTWHHAMVALDRETDFVNVVGTAAAEDCDERTLNPPTVRIEVPATGEAA